MRLNSLIADCIEAKKFKEDVGIEIETELNKGFDVDWNNSFWSVKGDGSLRGHGYEFVLKRPILNKDVCEAVKSWKVGLDKHKLKCNSSERTSVHVHKNVQSFTVLQGVTAVCAYWLLEPFLVDFCGDSRKGNNFCLTLQDADGIHSQLIQGIKEGKTFSNIAEDTYRYSSLNIAAINRFGSLENRLMRGTDDFEEISNWTSAFSGIIDKSKKFKNPQDFIKALDKDGPSKMLASLLSPEDIRYFSKFSKGPAPEQKLMENAFYINDIAEAKKSWDFTKDKASLEKDYKKLLKIKVDYLHSLGWSTENAETIKVAKGLLEQELIKKNITDFNDFLSQKVREPTVAVRARRADQPIFAVDGEDDDDFGEIIPEIEDDEDF